MYYFMEAFKKADIIVTPTTGYLPTFPLVCLDISLTSDGFFLALFFLFVPPG